MNSRVVDLGEGCQLVTSADERTHVLKRTTKVSDKSRAPVKPSSARA
jgi:hypothetical protein